MTSEEWERTVERVDDGGLFVAPTILEAAAYQAGHQQGLEEAAEVADELHLDWKERHCTNQDAADAIRKLISEV